MSEYKCDICCKSFSRKWCLTRHQNKKTQCKYVPPKSSNTEHQNPAKFRQNECKYCHRIFTRNDSLKKHLHNRCKIKINFNWFLTNKGQGFV